MLVFCTAARPASSCNQHRWLALDDQIHQSWSARFPKQKTNKFNLPRQQHGYPRESLASINVLPKNAPQEIVEKYGPKSLFGRGDGEPAKETRQLEGAAQRTVQAPRKGKARATKKLDDTKEPGPASGSGSGADLDVTPPHLAPLIASSVHDADEWSRHPPCPDPHDLIGFVTSGGHNLSQGRGTAVGAVWAQRVLEGWADAADADLDVRDADRDRDRIKRLCIVRNAGERIGRLGVWEVCR